MQTEYLAQQTNMVGTFGKFIEYQGGAYGMATLSAKPLISTKVIRLQLHSNVDNRIECDQYILSA